MPHETIRFAGDGGIELAVHHLGGDGPPVMLAHATGFHGRCWTPLARHLSERYSVWALDQRGHGESERPPGGRFDDWGVFAADLLAAVDAVDTARGAGAVDTATAGPPEPAGVAPVGAVTNTGPGGGRWRAGGHSLGGAVSLLAEARRPGTFRAIACYEPVVIPPDDGTDPPAVGPPAVGPRAVGPPAAEDPSGRPADRGPNPLATLARKRRPTFASRQAAYDNYRSKPPFAAFDAEALRCYVEFGLVDQPDGTVALACRREDEAAVFEGAMDNPAWAELPAVRVPVAVMAGGDGSDPVARAAPLVARRLPRAGLITFSDLDHFGPMTDPARVGEAMARAFVCARPDRP